MSDHEETTPGRIFRVVSAPVGVYAEAGFDKKRIGELPVGTQIEVDDDSRRRVEGVIWWQHSGGWSPQRSVSRDQIYMVRVNRKYFKVIDGPLSIRPDTSLESTRSGELLIGTVIEVDPKSQTEANGFIWWNHAKGWSAERSIDGSRIFLEAFSPGKSDDEDEPKDPAKPAPVTPEVPKVRYLRVTNGPLSVRAEANTSASRRGTLNQGDEIEVDSASRIEAVGYVWWKHAVGWSAERSLDSSTIFMEQISALTKPPVTVIVTPTPTPTTPGVFQAEPIFSRLPVDINQTAWVQYFGNTQFAYNIRKEGKTWYNYSQSLHGGFDFGNSAPGIPIYAGLEGKVVKLERNSSNYSPNYLMVRTGSRNQFLVVYGHIAAPNNFNVGDRVTPDMILARIDSGGQNHLHLEVRFEDMQIVNPLLVMPDVLRDSITMRWSNYSQHFYRDATWTQWQTPYDQPILKLSAPGAVEILGPHGRR